MQSGYIVFPFTFESFVTEFQSSLPYLLKLKSVQLIPQEFGIDKSTYQSKEPLSVIAVKTVLNAMKSFDVEISLDNAGIINQLIINASKEIDKLLSASIQSAHMEFNDVIPFRSITCTEWMDDTIIK